MPKPEGHGYPVEVQNNSDTLFVVGTDQPGVEVQYWGIPAMLNMVGDKSTVENTMSMALRRLEITMPPRWSDVGVFCGGIVCEGLGFEGLCLFIVGSKLGDCGRPASPTCRESASG